MKPIRLKTRTYRSSDELDRMLIEAATVVNSDPSSLLRDFVRQGSETILKDQALQKELRKKYALG